MKRLVHLLLLSAGITVTSFCTPTVLVLRTSTSASAFSPVVVSRTILRVSSSAPPGEGSDQSEAEGLNVGKRVKEADDELMDYLVQGGLVCFAAIVSYAAMSSLVSTVGGAVTTAAGGISNDATDGTFLFARGLWSILSTIAVAVWEGLQYILPIIFKAIYQGTQVALPVIKDSLSEVSQFAAPYVEEARSEVAQVAGPYVEQLSEALQQATDAAVVEPIQKASESLAETVDATIWVPIQEFQQVVDSTLVVPAMGVQESFASAVDTNLLAPIDHVNDAVEKAKASVANAIDSNVFAPINQVKDTFQKSMPTFSEFDDTSWSSFKDLFGQPPASPDAVLGPVDVVKVEGSDK
jgi:hypothetical protein